jgi:hypothetical protein
VSVVFICFHLKVIFYDQSETATATTLEEIVKLGQAGYVKYDEVTLNGTLARYCRKPKRFSSYANVQVSTT